VRIEAISPHIMRWRLSHDGKWRQSPLNRYGFVSENVGSDSPHIVLTERPDAIQLATEVLQVRTERASGRMQFCNASGRRLLQGSATDGFRVSAEGHVASFDIGPDELFYGFGDQNRERLEHRGTSPRMWVTNVNRYIPIPFFMSNRGYGMLVNTTRDLAFDIGSKSADRLTFTVIGTDVDFYFIYGPEPAAILDHYTRLTGRPTLPPKWSFGLWFVCRTQANDHEVIADAYTFRREGIPCDAIMLEPGWMQTFYDASVKKDWHVERFPIPSYSRTGPDNFPAALKRMGFKIGLWECNDYDLSIEAERRLMSQEEMDARDQDRGVDDGTGEAIYLEPDEHLRMPRRLDSLTQKNEPWFEHHRKFIDQGVDFFKQDGAYQVLDHPDRLWANGMTDAEMHNLYPLLYSQQMYEGFKEYTKRRPCCFTPAGWAGLQRYTGTWTGDTGGGPGTILACLNLAMSGHHLVTCDMQVTSKEGIHYGFLLPWAQVNSWNYWRHPWLLGDELGPIFKEYAELRYRLLPYIYSCAYEAHLTGMPLMRPMPLAFATEPESHNYLRQWMFGPALLVGAFCDELYLPGSGVWHDYWTGECIQAPCTIVYTAPPNRGGALFVKGGTLLPMAPPQPYVGSAPANTMTLEVFPGADSHFRLYDDDGVSLDYEHGRYAVTPFCVKQETNALTIGIGERQGSYSGMPDQVLYTLEVHMPEQPARVSTDAGEAKWCHKDGLLRVDLGAVGRKGCVCKIM
jgi:alpha-glucosidase